MNRLFQLFGALFISSLMVVASVQATGHGGTGHGDGLQQAGPVDKMVATTIPLDLGDISGTYNVSGQQAVDKERYEGVGMIKKNGEVYHVTYQDDEEKLTGIGIVEKNVLGVAFISERKPYILMLQGGPNGSLMGHWAEKGDMFTSSEVWKRR